MDRPVFPILSVCIIRFLHDALFPSSVTFASFYLIIIMILNNCNHMHHYAFNTPIYVHFWQVHAQLIFFKTTHFRGTKLSLRKPGF